MKYGVSLGGKMVHIMRPVPLHAGYHSLCGLIMTGSHGAKAPHRPAVITFDTLPDGAPMCPQCNKKQGAQANANPEPNDR